MDTYGVRVNREDGRWSAIVDEVGDGVRESLIDLFHHEDFELEWTFTTEHGDFTGPLRHALEQADVAENARANLDRARREAVGTMRAAGLSYQEIGDALGLSKARVSQIHHAA